VRTPKHVPGTIIQDIPLVLSAVLTAQVRTATGADTSKIMSSLAQEIFTRLQQIPCIVDVQAVNLIEREVPMASKETH
jgi:hypothetical protein